MADRERRMRFADKGGKVTGLALPWYAVVGN